MVFVGAHLVAIVVMCLPIIRGYWVPLVDEVTAENGISNFVQAIIEEDTCGGVITTVAEPREPGPMSNREDCFMCNGECYREDDWVNLVRSDVAECFNSRRIERKYRTMCHQFADFMNAKRQCDGGSYRCYGDDVHESLKMPKWKPVCVCDAGFYGPNCMSGFVQQRKCSIAVQDENECDCLVKVSLQSWYRK